MAESPAGAALADTQAAGTQAAGTQPPGGPVRCVVIGGSLVGLSTAIALARTGFTVTVAERSPARAADGGGGLGVDVALLQAATGLTDEPPVLHGVDRDGTAWHLLQAWLEEHAARIPGIRVLRGTEAISAAAGGPDGVATVTTAGRGTFEADLVIGADGARSTIRAAVDPDHPDGHYAGVLLWRTLVDEQAMPRGVALPADGEPAREIYAGPYRLVTYPVPGPAGQTARGSRRLNMVWYDPEQSELLRSASGTVFGTPIVHYQPGRLANGRIALAGDAAHAASPMVGGGFRQGLQDVLALSKTLAGITSADGVPGALAAYQELRLRQAIAHVRRSEQATAAYLAHATAGAGR
jgi:2-polyprenyl-6-methoxyphenol hydroxylase-like FAD-dependent oxidoreductase